MANPHRRLPSVDVLATRPTGTKCLNVALCKKRFVSLWQRMVCHRQPLGILPLAIAAIHKATR